MQNKQYINSVLIEKNSIKIKHGDVLSKYLNEDFYAEYESNFDLSNLDEGVAVIPFVLATAQIIWCSGEKVVLKRLEKKFSESLQKLKEEYKRMYKHLPWNGEIIVENEIDVNYDNKNLDGLLFSGGLDSIHSAFSHPDLKLLFTIWGADTEPEDEFTEWQYLKKHSQIFSSKFNRIPIFIKSNFRTFLNEPVLHTWHKDITHWYSHVQHGAALIGLCAPILTLCNSNKLLIASSHVEGKLTRGWGSTKLLDESIQFSNCKIVHDGYDKSRQAKSFEISQYAKKNAINGFKLMVCTHRIDFGENCSKCEKCLRTAIGLVVEGEDPLKWGFSLSAIDSLIIFKKKMMLFQIKMTANEVFMWQQIQNRINELEYNKEIAFYMKWLANKNFELQAKLYNLYSGRFFYSHSPRILRKIIRKIYFVFRSQK